MSKEIQYTQPYKDWLSDIKSKIRLARMKVALAANAELILFYWELGKDISEKLSQTSWGNNLLDLLAKDLKTAFPESSGFSRSNLYNCLKFYSFYKNDVIVQRSVGQIPWRHNVLIVSKTNSIDEALFIFQKQ